MMVAVPSDYRVGVSISGLGRNSLSEVEGDTGDK